MPFGAIWSICERSSALSVTSSAPRLSRRFFSRRVLLETHEKAVAAEIAALQQNLDVIRWKIDQYRQKECVLAEGMAAPHPQT
ncbi:MAG: hypothetical protein HC828_13210 [Blastochloris sp.]|nr:hypothetical protein [Blastochloris sp.]